jgi:hypothetical protein
MVVDVKATSISSWTTWNGKRDSCRDNDVATTRLDSASLSNIICNRFLKAIKD